jgi:hypothetical protein
MGWRFVLVSVSDFWIAILRTSRVTDSNRPKTDAERRERTLASKRRWAKKNRAMLKAKQTGVPFDEAAWEESERGGTPIPSTSMVSGDESSTWDPSEREADQSQQADVPGPSVTPSVEVSAPAIPRSPPRRLVKLESPPPIFSKSADTALPHSDSPSKMFPQSSSAATSPPRSPSTHASQFANTITSPRNPLQRKDPNANTNLSSLFVDGRDEPERSGDAKSDKRRDRISSLKRPFTAASNAGGSKPFRNPFNPGKRVAESTPLGDVDSTKRRALSPTNSPSPSKSLRDRNQRTQARRQTPFQTPPSKLADHRRKQTTGSPGVPTWSSEHPWSSPSAGFGDATSPHRGTQTPNPGANIFRMGPTQASSPATGHFAFSSPTHPDMSKSLGLVPNDPSSTFLGEFDSPR